MLTPEEQLLVICARPRLTAALSERLRTLMEKELDWRIVVNGAIQNLIVPLLAHHTLTIESPRLDNDARNLLLAARDQVIIRMMHIAGLRQRLISDYLLALNVQFVELKGDAISRALYGASFIRQYRDIDLLVDESRLLHVAIKLESDGWKVMNKEWDPDQGRTLDVLSKFQAAIEMRHPSGVVVELHRTLDNSGCVFNPSRLLKSARNARAIGVLPLHEHVAYLCFHHSRHKWESLHWCGDAAAIADMTATEIESIRKFARSHGFESTIDETLKLARNLAEMAETGESISYGESRFLADFLRSLRGSVYPEIRDNEADENERQPDYSYAWQRSRWYKMKFAMSLLRPTLNDHNWLPLDPGWRWMYWFTRPIRIFSRGIQR